MGSHYTSPMGWGRFITILMVVVLVIAIASFIYFVKKVKSNQYFGTVLPAVSADTIYDNPTLAR